MLTAVTTDKLETYLILCFSLLQYDKKTQKKHRGHLNGSYK